MGSMEGRRALILGVANDHSIAYFIARRLRAEGAEVGLTFPNEAIEKRLRPLADEIGAAFVLPCDVSRDADISSLVEQLPPDWSGLDVLVHAIAFAGRDELKGRFVETSRLGFQNALDISVYSLIALARMAEPLLRRRGGSILTLSYFGAEKVIPNYNIMGIAKAALEATVRYLAADMGPNGVRVNAISAGPLRTLSSAGIAGFKAMLHHHAERSPLRRNTTAEEVASAALFLCSELGAGITGEVVHVDAGYNIIGM
jgi:enoyl-[acyl-carrier protein] reductase I